MSRTKQDLRCAQSYPETFETKSWTFQHYVTIISQKYALIGRRSPDVRTVCHHYQPEADVSGMHRTSMKPETMVTSLQEGMGAYDK
jgi:hypothetical protein